MKIWGEIPKVSQVYEKKSTSKVDKASATEGKQDVVSISNNAKDYQTVMKALREIPEIREDKVEEIQKKYDTGQYDVSGSDVADKILKSIKERGSI